MRSNLTLFVCVCLLANSDARANLIVNGSFETPLSPTGGFINYPGGSTAITGWTVVGVDSSLVEGTFTQSGITFQAEHGNQWIDTAGYTSNSMTSGVTQNVPTTVGAKYEISFYVGSATDGVYFFPTTIDLSIDGGPRTSYTNLTAPSNLLDWQKFTVLLTAASSLTSVTFYNGGAPTNYLSGLDDVSMSIVSLPGDGNGDGWVDGLDYLLWAGAYGTHPGPDGDISDGDYNDDGWVDGLDYLLWAENYGSHTGGPVPESSASLTLTFGICAWVVGTRPRRLA